MSVVQGRIVEKAKPFLSSDDRQTLTRQAGMTQAQLFRLAESMHPIAWRERGLPAALRETIGRALDETDTTYSCDIQGRGLSQLATAVHQTIYRLATEAIAYMCGMRRFHRFSLVLRGGKQSDGHRWAVLRIVGYGDPALQSDPANGPGRPGISSLLGTQGMDIQSMRDHVALFDGVVHVRDKGETFEMSMLIHDAQHMSVGRAIESPAAKLWVR
jgi:two-component system, NarL family, sensor histidine kinase FusK